ncbi:MAG: DRTGG domain-containing protein [Thermodesulfobacteriota bacterium]
MQATLAEIAAWLQAEVLCGQDRLARAIALCHGADMMSDVLAFSRPASLLLTGLSNPQVVRTAEVAGIAGVIFVRGKRPSEAMVLLAQEFDLPLMVTAYSMFDACGLLFEKGLRGWSLPGGGNDA